MRRVKKNSGADSEPVSALPRTTKATIARPAPIVSNDFFIDVLDFQQRLIIPEKKVRRERNLQLRCHAFSLHSEDRERNETGAREFQVPAPLQRFPLDRR